MRHVNDLRKFIPMLILLNPESEYEFISGVKDLHLGAIFTVNNPDEEFLLRITVRPSKIAVF